MATAKVKESFQEEVNLTKKRLFPISFEDSNKRFRYLSEVV